MGFRKLSWSLLCASLFAAGAAAQEPQTPTDGKVSPVNTMPFILDAVKAYATVGEICDALREVYGTYEESAFA